MVKRTKESQMPLRMPRSQVVSTTIGELIAAISDAARESAVTEKDVFVVTRKVLDNILKTATHP